MQKFFCKKWIGSNAAEIYFNQFLDERERVKKRKREREIRKRVS